MSGPIFFVVLLIALGVGGYYGWPSLQQYLESRNAPERPAVVMPNIPAELMPRMQSIADAAIGDVVGAVDRATRSDHPQGPDPNEPSEHVGEEIHRRLPVVAKRRSYRLVQHSQCHIADGGQSALVSAT